MLVVHPAALILFVQTLLGGLVVFAVELHNVLFPEIQVCADIDVQCIGAVLQDVVCVPAHNDTGTFLSQLQNDVALGVPQIVRRGQAVHDPGNALGRESIREYAAAGGVLGMLFHELRREAGFFCNIFNEFAVIERNPQLIRDQMANGTSTGTKLTANGNDFLFHNITSNAFFDTYIIVNLTGKVNPSQPLLGKFTKRFSFNQAEPGRCGCGSPSALCPAAA